MKIHQNIRRIRESKKVTLKVLQRNIIAIFGSNALSYRSLVRIEQGYTDGRVNSLYQICAGLGITFNELSRGTEEEYSIADCIKKEQRRGKYTYNNKAYAEILTNLERKFIAMELILEKEAKTQLEKDPESEEGFEKCLYVLSGKIKCVVRDVTYVLTVGDCVAFESSIPHYFENISPRKSRCIVVQNPRHI